MPAACLEVEKEPLDSLDVDQLRRKCLALQYNYGSLQNEYEISKLSSEREMYSLRNRYDKSMNELQNALNDTKSLYEENIQLKEELKQLKLKEPREDLVDGLKSEILRLNHDVRLRDQTLSDLKNQSASHAQEIESRVQPLLVELEGCKRLIENYETRLDQRLNETRKLQQDIKQKNEQISELQAAQVINSNPNYCTEDLKDLTLLNKTLKEQLKYTEELESMNLKQATELKKLRQMKDVQSFLEKENKSLQSKIDGLQPFEERAQILEEENITLREKVRRWDIGDLEKGFGSLEGVIQELSRLSSENSILTESNSRLQVDFNKVSLLNDELAIERNQLLDLNKDYETSILNLKRLNHELEQQKMLSFEECKILTQQLKEYEKMSKGNNDGDQSMITDIIEGYKNQTENLTNELIRLNKEFINSEDRTKKRRKVTDDLGVGYSQRLNELTLKNRELEQSLSKTTNHANMLQQKLEELSNLKEKKIRILQLRDNPLLKEQFVRKQTLELLKKENTELLRRAEPDSMLPRSVYDRLKHEMKSVELELQSSVKKTTRLKEVYNKKSLEFIEAINTLLGFKLEFLSHGKVKLISCYKPDRYIVADLQSNALKSDLNEIVPEWEELFQKYVIDLGELPVFLTHIKLRLWEQSHSDSG